MNFNSIPAMTPFDDGEWRLESPAIYATRAGEIIVAPAGFITDLASIPRIFHALIPVNGRHRLAAIVHDYLFVIQDRPRADVDNIFLEAMEDSGVGWVTRWAMYLAVRAGGWLPWGKNEHAIAENRVKYFAENGLMIAGV